ncbi:MAG: serine hydroxymethyltransferase [Rhizobiales bacterium]|nr:serine hydroxymethyltransferase [Hyphomicrobiales bacterium]
MPAKGESEVIVEMRPIGGVVRVAAIDVATGTEVVVMGPASASPQSLEQLAVAKLRRRLAKDSGG